MFPYVSESVVERVDLGDPAGLAGAVDRVLSDAPARAALVERGFAFSARYIHPVDGALAARFRAVVEEIRRDRAPGIAR